MLWMLSVLGPFAVLASDLPRTLAWPLALLAAGSGVFDAWRHARAPALALLIHAGPGRATCDGRPIQALVVQWRGPLAFLRWRESDGRVQRRAFWPDTLPPASRRELRLAALRMPSARDTASMAR